MPEKSARSITDSASLNSSIYKVTFGAKNRAKCWFLIFNNITLSPKLYCTAMTLGRIRSIYKFSKWLWGGAFSLARIG